MTNCSSTWWHVAEGPLINQDRVVAPARRRAAQASRPCLLEQFFMAHVNCSKRQGLSKPAHSMTNCTSTWWVMPGSGIQLSSSQAIQVPSSLPVRHPASYLPVRQSKSHPAFQSGIQRIIIQSGNPGPIQPSGIQRIIFHPGPIQPSSAGVRPKKSLTWPNVSAADQARLRNPANYLPVRQSKSHPAFQCWLHIRPRESLTWPNVQAAAHNSHKQPRPTITT